MTLPPPAPRAPGNTVFKEFLDSDRVNFLIWRYLLEGNYRETAAKFQKEWHVREPHRDFDFARYVKGHALVSVVNRGLLYYALERDYALNQLPQDAVAETKGTQYGIFGPLTAHPPPARAHNDEDAAIPAAEVADEGEASRKRPQQQALNGSPSKRLRLSNGCDEGADAVTDAAVPPVTAKASTPMDIDPPPLQQDSSQQDASNNHAYPSPLEGEQLPAMVQTDGPEQGTQVDKVEELSVDTTFIRLMDDDRGASDTSPSPSPASSENAPVLLQCEWNPRDPSVLAAAGTDALARVWTVSRVTAADAGRDHVVFPKAHTLLDPGTPRSTTVTALSWTSDGVSIAVATDSGSQAAVSMWTADGVNSQTLSVPEPPVIKLCWNPGNTALLAISPQNGGALATVYFIATSTAYAYRLPGHDIAATPLDATWTSDAEFLLCGGDLLLCLRCAESPITQVRKFETKEDDGFTQVLFDWRSKLAATSSDKGILDLWDESGQRRSISAHQGAITSMAWQPLPPSQQPPDDERLIATGGDDCAILIWNARRPDSKAKCFLTMDSPIVRLAFTPDGAFIAGATSRQVLIWKVDNHAMPRASWNRPPHPGWLSPKGTSDTDEEDEHCLCWDVSGRQLAYGSNSRLAVINFSR
ncbi:hypothetical protein XA68_15277 [Ophiocordyceps unilateralis]|uniref:LisH domain-containing protein n=1 Tax=Ophiocordyceps unilateralis TaxID=268505 RepID=A0A2A9PL36_OPHUN|nr:hypothetical protein XA68_15277 [Ophiocordyceps unilateralis]